MVASPEIFTAPIPLTEAHDPAEFECGAPDFDDWLKKRARANMASGASRTYVVCPSGSQKVTAYYAVAVGQIARGDVTAAMRRNMPTHIPAFVLARLAVNVSAQKRGLGTAMLLDAVKRTFRAATEVAVRLIIVHAITDEAEAFYERNGFEKLDVPTRTLALDLLKLRTA